MNYKSIGILVLLVFAALSMSSCATMFSKNKYPIEINSEPQGADIIITKRDGEVIFRGQTPATPILPTGDKIRKAVYKIETTMPGYKTTNTYVDYELDNIYYLNLALPIFGWFIGMPFLDPATGAMWKPTESTINITLEKEN